MRTVGPGSNGVGRDRTNDWYTAAQELGDAFESVEAAT
jgi:hypothetical protein